jgi:signal transduction histidine kinase
VRVTDNGAGIRPTARKGLGLAGMRDRITLLGGTITVEAGPNGAGVTVRAVLPIAEQAGKHHAAYEEDVQDRL